MRPLIEFVRLSFDESCELTNLLRASQISYRETSTNFIAKGAIWVEESQYEKAAEIVEALAKRSLKVSEQRREEGQEEWRIKWKGSYFSWLANQFRSPANVIRFFLLLGMLTTFLWYPMYYALKAMFG